MPIDTEPLACLLSCFIDSLPTEATFRGQTICVRLGEAPKTREMLVVGFQNAQVLEVLMKVEDANDTEPANGETITIADTAYKIGSVTPLLSLTDPAGYRLTISKTV